MLVDTNHCLTALSIFVQFFPEWGGRGDETETDYFLYFTAYSMENGEPRERESRVM